MNPTCATPGEDRSVTRRQRIRAPSTGHHDRGFARTWPTYGVSENSQPRKRPLGVTVSSASRWILRGRFVFSKTRRGSKHGITIDRAGSISLGLAEERKREGSVDEESSSTISRGFLIVVDPSGTGKHVRGLIRIRSRDRTTTLYIRSTASLSRRQDRSSSGRISRISLRATRLRLGSSGFAYLLCLPVGRNSSVYRETLQNSIEILRATRPGHSMAWDGLWDVLCCRLWPLCAQYCVRVPKNVPGQRTAEDICTCLEP